MHSDYMTDKGQKLCWFLKMTLYYLMSVSVPENEIICYNVDNAITNAKLRMQKWGAKPPVEKKWGPEPPPAPPAYSLHRSAVPTSLNGLRGRMKLMYTIEVDQY